MSSPRSTSSTSRSRADTVRQVTGAEIRETVPDSVLDEAEIELVDLPPAELLQRLAEGKVYVPDRAAAAAQNFFREGNLTALRELALRARGRPRRAERARLPRRAAHHRRVEDGASPARGRQPQPAFGIHRPLDAPHGGRPAAPWLAVHVENARPLSDDAQTRLQKNLAIARELGAEVIATSDEDLVAGILRVARQQNVTQIIVGKPAGSGCWNGCAADRFWTG